MEEVTKYKLAQTPEKRFQFNLSSHDLQCFISKSLKSKSSDKSSPNILQHQKPHIQLIQ